MQKENGSAKNIFVSYILLFLLKKENRTVKDQYEPLAKLLARAIANYGSS